MTGVPKFLERVGMTPESAFAVVQLRITVKTGTWGEDCTIAQAVAQAVESAKGKVTNLIKDDPDITLSDAEFVRVSCGAKKLP